MEFNKVEVAVVERAIEESVETQMRTLTELELLMAGGGSGDVSFL